MKVKLITTVALLVFVIVFMVQNAAMVEIKILFWEIAISRALLIFMMLLLGVVIGWFLRTMYRLSRTG